MGALSGIRVLDFSHVVAGPLATMLLGDLGAEITKVEPPGGDLARQFGPPFVDGESSYFLSIGRNKRSITLDMKTQSAQAVLKRLVDRSDVLVTNFRPGVMERYGLGFEQLAPQHPHLVYCRVTGYGYTGPWSHYPAFDQVVQGMSGLMSVTGSPETGPFRIGVPIADVLAAMMASYGILGALVHRERTGEGQLVDLALMDAVLPALAYQGGRYLAVDEAPGLSGNHHSMATPFGTYKVGSGMVNICVSGDPIWRRFCETLGAAHLIRDERFRTQPLRVQNRKALDAELERLLAGREPEELVTQLNEAGVPSGPIWSIKEFFESSYALSKELVQKVQHTTLGPIKTIAPVVHFSRTPAAIQCAPPVLGEHTAEILGEIGFSPAEQQAMRIEGTFGPPADQ